MKRICELNNKHRDSSGAVWEKAENKLCKQQTCPKLTGKETQSEFHLLSACTCYLFTFQLHQSRTNCYIFFKSENIRRKERDVERGKEGREKNKTIIANMY